jgi:hypothetical protein
LFPYEATNCTPLPLRFAAARWVYAQLPQWPGQVRPDTNTGVFPLSRLPHSGYFGRYLLWNALLSGIAAVSTSSPFV